MNFWKWLWNSIIKLKITSTIKFYLSLLGILFCLFFLFISLKYCPLIALPLGILTILLILYNYYIYMYGD